MKISYIFFNVLLSLAVVICGLFVYHNYLHDDIRIIRDVSPQFTNVSASEIYSKKLEALFSSAAPNDFIRAAQKTTSSVVYITAYEKVNGSMFSEGYKREKGSGVIISDNGDIVTNHHVIANADFIEVTLEDKREFVADVIGIDESTDLALLKIEANKLPYLVFANSDSLQIGEWILAVGNPFGLQSTVTAGIVSAKARNIDVLQKNDIESFIQSDVAINPGSSGGAFVNSKGLLMGICTAIISSSGNYDGISFAIPSNLVRKVIVDLKEFGSVQRGKLGIGIRDVDDHLANRINLPTIKGVYINSVNLNSAAAEGGLQKGDVITKIENKDIASTSSFYEQINNFRPGDDIKIKFYRNGAPKYATITLRNHLNTTDYLSVRNDKILRDLGIEIRDLNSIEKDRVRAAGVMVISVSKGSIIANTNMEPGFIVESFNDIQIENAQEFISLLKNTTGNIILKGFYERYPGEFPYAFELPN